MKKYTRKIIFGILIVFWMIIIFLFSNQNGDLSASKSQKIVNMIIKIFVKDFDSYSPIRQKELLSKLSFLIRKCAHMTEYAILALLVFFFLTDGLKLFRYIIKSSNNISNKKIVDINKTTRYRFLSLPVLFFKFKNTKIIIISNNGINTKSINEGFLVFL